MTSRRDKYVETARGGAREMDRWSRGRAYSPDSPVRDRGDRAFKTRMDESSRWHNDGSDGRRESRPNILSRVGDRNDRKRDMDDRDDEDSRGGKWRRAERMDVEFAGRRTGRWDGEFDRRRAERWDGERGGRRTEMRDIDYSASRDDRNVGDSRRNDGGWSQGYPSNNGGGRDHYRRADNYNDRGGYGGRDTFDQRGAYGRRESYGGRDNYPRGRDHYGGRGGYKMNQRDHIRNHYPDERRSVREDSESRSQGGDGNMAEGVDLRDVVAEFPFGFVPNRFGQEWEEVTGAAAELEFMFEPTQQLRRESRLVAC
eukprot:GFKZ01010220.1.p2 GENE.GFKZ01010220.1~~GFKZ01010220.1.p2  ORF type:complete len:313 (-),score=48.24 GFKZ01010220.1:2467-3405(-)